MNTTDTDARAAIVKALHEGTRGKSRQEIVAYLREFSAAARAHGIDPRPLIASAASREVFGPKEEMSAERQ